MSQSTNLVSTIDVTKTIRYLWNSKNFPNNMPGLKFLLKNYFVYKNIRKIGLSLEKGLLNKEIIPFWFQEVIFIIEFL